MGIMGEKTKLVKRCTVNFGPCDPSCNVRCCHEQCEGSYSQGHPEATCKYFSGQYENCLCTYDCQ